MCVWGAILRFNQTLVYQLWLPLENIVSLICFVHLCSVATQSQSFVLVKEEVARK
jgi:hypothetical protein